MVFAVPPSWLCWIGRPDAIQGGSRNATGDLSRTRLLTGFPMRFGGTKANDHDRVAVMFEAVISVHSLGMLH